MLERVNVYDHVFVCEEGTFLLSILVIASTHIHFHIWYAKVKAMHKPVQLFK